MTERVDTKVRILDAAEKLFGMNGFEGTSLRDITSAADVNLAAINYHFQTKDSLIDAIVARRIEPVNKKRFEMLDAAGPNPTVEQILTAFIAPVMVKADAIAPLMGRILSNPAHGDRAAVALRRFRDSVAGRAAAAATDRGHFGCATA